MHMKILASMTCVVALICNSLFVNNQNNKTDNIVEKGIVATIDLTCPKIFQHLFC